MLKRILRTIWAVISTIISLPINVVCILIWCVCALLNTINSGSFKDYWDETTPILFESCRAYVDWVKNGETKIES